MSVKLSPKVTAYAINEPDFTPGLSGVLFLPYLPSQAFGDQGHPTTCLCVTAVDFLCRTKKVIRFLDVGTGSGVLARVARLRGVVRVCATEIDPKAIEASLQNFALDDPGLPQIEVKNQDPDRWLESFDLICANILEGPLQELAPSLSQSLTLNGDLLISGFTALQVPALTSRYQKYNLKLIAHVQTMEWSLLHFVKI